MLRNSGVIENIPIVLNDYFSTFQVEPVWPRFLMVEDMIQAYVQLRPDIAQSSPDSLAIIKGYNGVTVPPCDLGEQFHVLLNRKFMDNYWRTGNKTWVGTLAHETTHVKDFMEYAELSGAPSYDEVMSIEKNAMFSLWTEFNARAKGYYFVRKYTFDGYDMFDERFAKDVLDRELPEQDKLYRKNFSTAANNWQIAYHVANYLGRLYSLQMIFPGAITDERIRSLPMLQNNPYMCELYFFLKGHAKIETAYQDFDKMESIFESWFRTS